MSESLNRDQYDQLVAGIADGRHKSEADVRGLIDRGPFQAQKRWTPGWWTTSRTRTSSTMSRAT
jgi:hypothetical protein